MRVVKYFSYEIPLLHRVSRFGRKTANVNFCLLGIYGVREGELRGIRRIYHAQSAKYVSHNDWLMNLLA